MLVSSSLPIDVVVDYLADVDADGVVAADLLTVLGRVVDPRARRGVGQCLVSVLAVSVCAVVAGARSFCAIAEWAADAPVQAATIRRVLQALDAMIGTWPAGRGRPTPGRRVIAVDGK